MLANLFKPAWKSHSVEKRLKAIAEFDLENEEHQKNLIKLANDADESVCIAAIKKINSVSVLHEISLKKEDEHKSKTLPTVASKRLNELLGESASLNPQAFEGILKQFPDLSVRVAAHAETASIRHQAILGLSSDQLVDVLSVTTYTDSRQQIADTLNNVDALESARKILRGKDKNAERIVKTKLDEFKYKERQQAENLVIVNELIDEVEYLSSRDDWLPEFIPRCKAHCKRWDKLDFDIGNGLKQRYQVARDILDSQYQQRLAIQEAQQSQQKMLSEVQTLVKHVSKRDMQSSIESFFESHEKNERIKENWESSAEKSEADQSVNNKYLENTRALTNAFQLIEAIAPLFPKENKTKKNIVAEARATEQSDSENQPLQQPVKALSVALNKFKWPSKFGVFQLEVELKQQLAEWNKANKENAEMHDQQLSAAHKNISSIFHFARVGNLTRAKQTCVNVEKSFAKFSGKDLAALKMRYEEASENLGDMGDWKSFATEPKYIELCEAMEQLHASKLHPDKLFKEMKSLQQQWKELGNSDISEQHWPRFKQASDAVYEPCSVFFDERRELRKANFEKRQKHVEAMRELLEQSDETNKPDYKVVESTLRSINSRFTAIKDVEHKPGQKQWEQFSKLKDGIYAKLGIEYDANIEQKNKLIEQAEALAQEEAKEENLTTLKTLQFRWKQIGVTRRKDDQKAWTEFKRHGDQVFAKIQEIRQGQRAETDQQLNAYREIIKSIQTLAKTATELSEADHQFSTLQASYDELPDLTKLTQPVPEKLIEGIQRDYRNACLQFDDCHERIINNNRKTQLEALRLKADLCSQLEALFIARKGEKPDAKKLEKIMQQWDSIVIDDSALLSRIESRFKSTQTNLDRTEITEQRRLMCIKLEIAKDVETPAEDKAERMQFQLDQMNESGLGQQALNLDEQLKNIQLDWLCLLGAEPQQQAKLDKRFWCAFDHK